MPGGRHVRGRAVPRRAQARVGRVLDRVGVRRHIARRTPAVSGMKLRPFPPSPSLRVKVRRPARRQRRRPRRGRRAARPARRAQAAEVRARVHARRAVGDRDPRPHRQGRGRAARARRARGRQGPLRRRAPAQPLQGRRPARPARRDGVRAARRDAALAAAAARPARRARGQGHHARAAARARLHPRGREHPAHRHQARERARARAGRRRRRRGRAAARREARRPRHGLLRGAPAGSRHPDARVPLPRGDRRRVAVRALGRRVEPRLPRVRAAHGRDAVRPAVAAAGRGVHEGREPPRAGDRAGCSGRRSRG